MTDVLLGVGRSLGALCLGALGALIAFGLLLALAWRPASSDNATYKLITLLLVVGTAFFAGGYVSGLLTRPQSMLYGLGMGVLLGTVAFGYILGPHWLLLIAVPLSGLLGALGGRLAS